MTMTMTELYEGEKYFTTQEGLKATLDKFGVAIIPGVLNQEECDAMNAGAFDYLEALTSKLSDPISRRDQRTWRQPRNLWVEHGLMMQHCQIGHAQHVWDVRQNPKVYNTFAALLDTPAEDLICSFDGVSVHFPPEITNDERDWFREPEPLCADHICCHTCPRDDNVIQAWVTANAVEVGDATLAFVEGSHKLHDAAAEKFNITKRADWYKENETVIKYCEHNGCELHYIKCPAGSIIYWDSRTLCGEQKAQKSRARPNTLNVVKVCYVPRQFATEAALTKKRRAFSESLTTSNSPHNPITFARDTKGFQQRLLPNVSEIGKRMAGL